MKTNFKIITLAVLSTVFAFSTTAQDKPQFYTDNGSKVVTEMSCSSLKDFSVKIPIAANMFKFDNIDITVEVDMNQKQPGSSYQDIVVYGLYMQQKKFSVLYEGKKEISLWLVNPKDGWGDLAGQDGNIREGVFCGSTPKEKVDVKVSVYGYFVTGEKEKYNESTSVWEKIPIYDEGTALGEATIVVKQTEENMASAKKAKLKGRFGLK